MKLCLYMMAWFTCGSIIQSLCRYKIIANQKKKQTEEHLKLSCNICIDVCCCNELVRRKYFLRDLFISSH